MEQYENDQELEVTAQETETPVEVERVEETVAFPVEETEKTSQKKSSKVTITVSPWKIVAATALLMLLLVVLVFALVYGITGKLPYGIGEKSDKETAAPTTADTTPTTPRRTAEELGMTIEGITDRELYAGEDDAVVAGADEVVATVGNYSITNSQLQVFYWMEFSSFLSDASDSGYDPLTTYELDVTKPLGSQLVIQSVVTWEQFFLHNSLGTFWRYAALNTLADAAQFEISDTDKAELEKVPQQLEEDAEEEGYESAEAMIKDRLGAGCTVEDFVFYMTFVARGDLYANQFIEEYDPSQEEIEEFFELNAEYYSYYGITKETPKTRDVRHVLLVPEGAVKDESTGHITATDEQWEAGLIAAQAMLDAWVEAGAKEEDFAAMANEHSTDGGSNTNGGLYEDVITGQMVATFNDWLFDASRQSGDYGIVRTDFGYHLMYFVGEAEEETWLKQATKDCISSGYFLNVKLSEAMETDTLSTVLEKVVLSDVKQEAAEEE